MNHNEVLCKPSNRLGSALPWIWPLDQAHALARMIWSGTHLTLTLSLFYLSERLPRWIDIKELLPQWIDIKEPLPRWIDIKMRIGIE
ncbi:MAG: hypothetical protein J3Q66DRAFT_407552 [Benniella sp.]|nr:MAG: hypothetical protein J3Q66DRAFT_407552 [Benniella sp.]